MSTVIDKRVVEMEFENRQFEKGVQATIKSLENLEDKLQFKDGEKGFDRVASAANAMKLDDLEKSVDSISQRFTLLGNIGLQALQRISSAVVETGEKILKMFTIDPIMAGWNEFEIKTNSIQTILGGVRNSFESEEDAISAVGRALDTLNAYADKTIYSFSDMTSNIGKFTNQGVDLQTSVDAIKGISNWAASAGANTQQASHAMYNLSQALSGGYVRTIDWRSIENAQMATTEFKDLVIELAKLKTPNMFTKDGMIKKGKNLIDPRDFHSSLQAGWLTNDVLLTALQIYSNELTDAQLRDIGLTEEQAAKYKELGEYADKAATTVRTFTMLMDTLKEAAGSGWAQTFDILFGGFEGTKEFFTEISQILGDDGIIGRITNTRLQFADMFANTFGGSEAMKNSLLNLLSVFDTLSVIIDWSATTVGKMMIIPARLADGFRFLEDVFASINEWLLSPNEFNSYTDAWTSLYNILNGVFSTLVTVMNIVGEAFGFVINIASLFSPILDVILMALGDIGQDLLRVNYDLSRKNGIHEFFEWLSSVIGPIVSSITTLIATVLKFIWTGVKLAKTKVVEWFGKFGTIVEDLPKKFEILSGKITGFFDRVKKAFAKIGKIKFKGALEPIEKLRIVLMTFVETVFGNDALVKAGEWFDNTFKPLFGDLINWASEKWAKLKSFITDVPQKISDFSKKFEKGWEAMKSVKYDKTLTPLQNFSNKVSELVYSVFNEDMANKIRDIWNYNIYPLIATAIKWSEKNVVPIIEKVTSFVERAWKGLVAAITDSGENGIEGRVLAFFKVFNNDENTTIPKSFKNLFSIQDELEKWKNETLTPFLVDAQGKLPEMWKKAKAALFGYEEQDERYAGRTTHVNGFFDNVVEWILEGKKRLEEKLPAIIEAIQSVATEFLKKIERIYNSITNPSFGTYDMHSDPYEERNVFIDSVFGHLYNIKTAIDERWPSIWETITSFKRTVETQYAGAMNTIKEVIFGQEIDDDAPRSTFLEQAFSGMSGVIDEVQRFLFGYEEQDERYAGRSTHVPGAWDKIKQFGETAYNYITTEGPIIWGTIKSFYEKYIKPVIDLIVEFGTLLAEALGGFFTADVDENASFAERLATRLGSFETLGGWINGKVTELLGNLTGEGGIFSQISEVVTSFLGIDQQVDEVAAETGKKTKLSFIERLLDPIFRVILRGAKSEGLDEVKGAVEQTKKESGGIMDMLSGAAGGISDIVSKLFGNSFFRVLGLIFTVKNLSTIVKGLTGTKGVGGQIADIMDAVGGIIGSMAKLFLVLALITAIGGPDAIDKAVDAITKVLDKVFWFIGILAGVGVGTGIGSDVLAHFMGGKGEGLDKVSNIILGIGTGIKSLMEGLLLLAVNIVVFGILDKILGLLDIDLQESLNKIGEMLIYIVGSIALLIGAVNLASAGMPSEARSELFKNMDKISVVLDSLVNALKIFVIAVIAFEIFGGWEKVGPEITALGVMLVMFGVIVGGLIYGLIELKKNLIFGKGIDTIGSILSTLGPILALAVLSIIAVATTLVIAANNMPKDLDALSYGLLLAGIAVISLVIGALVDKFANIAVKMTAIPWMSILKTFVSMVAVILGVGIVMFALEKLMKIYTKDMSVLIFNLGSDLSSFYSMTKDLELATFENAVKCLKTVVGGFQSIMLSLVNPSYIDTIMDVIRDSSASLSLANWALSGVDVTNFEKPKAIFEKIQEASSIDPKVDDLLTKTNGIRDSGSSLVLAMSHFGKITQDDIDQVGMVVAYATNVKSLADVLNTIPAVNLDAVTVGAAVDQLTFDISTDKFNITEDGLIKELDPEKIKAFFRTMANSMPEQDVLDQIANFGGQNNLTSFSMGLTNLTGAIQAYSGTLGTINYDNLGRSEEFLTTIDGLGKKLPTDYSFVDRLSGVARGGQDGSDSRLGKFSNDIVTLGGAMEKYGEAINKANGVKLIASAMFLTKLASIEKNLKSKSMDGFLAAINIFGKKEVTLGDFANNIESLGGAISDFSTHLGNYDDKAFSAAVNNLKSIAGIEETLRGVMFDKDGNPIMNEVSVIWGLYQKKSADGEDRLSDFGNVVSRIGNGIKQFTQSLTNKNGEVPDMHKFESQVWFLKEIAGLSQQLIGLNIDNYGLSNLAADISSGVAGYEIVEFINAFSSVKPDALTNATSAISALKDIYDIFFGHDDPTSLSSAISSAISELNQSVITPTVRPVLDLSDPSMAQLSGFSGLGFSNRYVMENVTNFKMNEVQNVKMDSGDLSAITAAINNVGGSVGQVSTAIGGMYVRMDTGALVGQLAGPIDLALGRRGGRITNYSGSYSGQYP